MRILFAADRQSGYYATKAYNLTEGVGVRYVVTLYRLKDGELLAVMDGRIITDLRTGAASGVAARKVPVSGPVYRRHHRIGAPGAHPVGKPRLGVPNRIGRRVQSDRGEPRGLCPRDVGAARYSRFSRRFRGGGGARAESGRHREQQQRPRTGRAAASGCSGCRLLCAVGNTRPQFAEIDVRCFREASLVVMDSPLAMDEAGELRQALAQRRPAGGETGHPCPDRRRLDRCARRGDGDLQVGRHGPAGPLPRRAVLRAPRRKRRDPRGRRAWEV